MRRSSFIVLGCLVAVGILAAMWFGGRNNEVAAPFVRAGPTVTPHPGLDLRPRRVDVQQGTSAPLDTLEPISHIEPLANGELLAFNGRAHAWELLDPAGAHLETLSIPPLVAPTISPDRRRIAHVWGGELLIFDVEDHRTSRIGQDIDASAYMLWNSEGDRLGVLSFFEGPATTLLIVDLAEDVILSDRTWTDGEDVYLQEWTAEGALRVRVWADGGCSPSAPLPQCVGGASNVLEVAPTGLTSTLPVAGEVSSNCALEAGRLRCWVSPVAEGETVANGGEAAGAAAVTSPDGRYVATIARGEPDRLHIRSLEANSAMSTDIQFPIEDVSLVPTWSHDSRFLYLSRHEDCMRLDPPGC